MVKKKDSLTLEERLENALVPDWEQPYKVPSNWVWIFLGEVVLIKRGASPRPISSYITKDDKGVNWIKIGDTSDKKYVSSIKEKITQEGACKSVFVEKGTLLLSNSMSFGRPYILNIDGCIHDGWLAITPNESFEKEYLYYALLASNWYFEQVAVGTSVRNLNSERVAKTPTPLPPLPEQRRIVDRIENLFSKLDEAKEKAQTALDCFENRKTAILHKAFSGKLTKKWREVNGEIENDYLENIQEYLDKLDKKDRLKMQEQIDKIERCEITGWLKCSVGAIGVVTNGSTPSRKIDEYWNGKINWVSSGEIKNNIIRSTRETISQLGYDNSSVKLLPKDTVLIAMIGEGKTRGQSAILEIEATINQNIAAVVVNKSFVFPKFLWYCFQMNYKANREKGSGSGPQALNCQRVRELDFILPTLLEQIEIVRILDNIFEKEQKANELVRIIEKIDLMKKAILARAFRGELDTNNPKDESALELLKDILSDN